MADNTKYIDFLPIGRIGAILLVAATNIFVVICFIKIPLCPWQVMVFIFCLSIESVDLSVGIVHWACDTYFKYEDPYFGDLVKTFRNHHSKPTLILTRNYIYANSNTYVFGMLLMIILYFTTLTELKWFIFFYVVAGINTAEFHKWAHTPNVPRYISFLQKLGLIVSREHHRKHHQSLSSHYATVTGHTDWIMDKLKIYRFLEWIIYKFFRILPICQDPITLKISFSLR